MGKPAERKGTIDTDLADEGPLLMRWLPPAQDAQRFHAALDTARTELREHEEKFPGGWVQRAETHLQLAQRHFRKRRMNPAWSSLKAAQRHTIWGYDDSELAIESERLDEEAASKLGGWRLETTMLLLGHEKTDSWGITSRVRRLELAMGMVSPPDASLSERLSKLEEIATVKGPGEDPPERVNRLEAEFFATLRHRVVAARRILDEHTDNVYTKQGILRRTIMIASFILALILGALVIAVWRDWTTPLDDSGSKNVLTEWKLLVVVFILGALGAVLSGATNAISGSASRRIPDVRVRSMLMWARPLIGAGSAVVVIVLLQSGLTAISLTDTGVYAAAIVAGFSERLVSSTVEKVSAGLEK